MKRKLLFLFSCMIFACSIAISQNLLPFFRANTVVNNSPFYLVKQRPFSFAAAEQNKKAIASSMLVSPTFYCSNLAFFCRQEIKFEKITKIPFKFRLGSVQYVDYLEGKRGAILTR